MKELIENTERLVEDFNDQIRSDLNSKGIDNTREAANSLRVETTKTGSKINISSKGVFYLEFLDKGRGPGKFPPVNLIQDWAINKPVDINPFLIGRKISLEGTNIFKDNSKGIQLDKKRQELQSIIKEDAPKWVKQDLLIQLKGLQSKFKR